MTGLQAFYDGDFDPVDGRGRIGDEGTYRRLIWRVFGDVPRIVLHPRRAKHQRQ